MTKIVINSCFGGFSVSRKAILRYAELKGIPLYIEKTDWDDIYWTVPKEDRVGVLCEDDFYKASIEDRKKSNEFYEAHTISNRYFDRTDPILVQVVEELGDDANGDCARLQVVSLEKGTLYCINEYDGYESIEIASDCLWSIA
jgi:hypothetical protein